MNFGLKEWKKSNPQLKAEEIQSKFFWERRELIYDPLTHLPPSFLPTTVQSNTRGQVKAAFEKLN